MRNHRQLAAFLLVAVTFAAATWTLGRREADDLRHAQKDASTSIWQSQREGCNRGNQLRTRTNETRSTLRFILVSAAASAPTKTLHDRYLDLAARIQFEPITDCVLAYPRPPA